MDPVTMTLLGIGAGGNLLGNWLSGNSSDDALRKYEGINDQALQDYLNNYQTPGYQDLNYNPEQYQFSPMEALNEYAMPTDVEGKLVDGSPEMRAIQMDALNKMIERANEGMSATDLADFTKQRSQVEEAARGREGAIVNNFAARGLGGSGAQGAFLADTQQDAMERLNEEALNRAATNAQQRALAEMQKATLAGTMENRDIGLNTTNANIMNQFALNNSAAKQAISKLNTQLKNSQIMQNYQNRTNTNNANVDLRNTAFLNNARDAQTKQAQRNAYNQDIAKTKYSSAMSKGDAVLAQGSADAAKNRNYGNVISALPGQYMDYTAWDQKMYPPKVETNRDFSNYTNNYLENSKNIPNKNRYSLLSENDEFNTDYNY